MRKKKRRAPIRIGLIIAFVLLSGCRNLVLLAGSAPLAEDVYFQSYSIKDLETTIYKYDARTKTVQEVGRVLGYFHNCIIDSGKTAITGVRSPFFPPQMSEAESDSQVGVVRFFLESGRSELLRSEEQLRIGEKEHIVWNQTFPYGDGNQMCICYKGQEMCYLLYDLKTAKAKRMDSEIRRVCDIRDNRMWYLTRRGLKCYHMKTRERKELFKGIRQCSISDNGRKAVSFQDGAKSKRIYLYDTARKTQQCILRAGWNRVFEDNSSYAFGWDKSGMYCYYIEHFVKLFNSSDIRIKICNLRTGKSTCIYLHQNAPASTEYEFIRNADENGGM